VRHAVILAPMHRLIARYTRPVPAPSENSQRNSGVRLAVLCLLVAMPVVLVLLASLRGPGISVDSVDYASAAQSLANSGGLLTFTGVPLTNFPPGYSALLGLLAATGISIETVAVCVNAVCVALLVILTYLLARSTVASANIALAAAAIVSLAASTVRVYSMLWSEAPFTALALATLLVLTRALGRSSIRVRDYVILALGASLATSMRYVGFLLIPVIMVGVYLIEQQRGRARGAVAALIAGAAASIGLIVVAARNLALDAAPLGERFPGVRTIEAGIKDTIFTLGSYVAPPETTTLTAEVGVLIGLCIVVGAWSALRARNRGLVLLGLFVAVYWAVMWWSQASTRLDTISDRFAAPVLAPMAILAIVGIRATWAALTRDAGHRPRLALLLRAGATLVVAAVLGLSVLHSVQYSRASGSDGVGYNSAESLDSPLAESLAGLRPGDGLASNEAARAYWISRRTPLLRIPSADFTWPPGQAQRDLEALQQAVADGSVGYLAVFSDVPDTLTPEQLADAGIPTEVVSTYPDGILYRINDR
jgi:hypothetical protein